MGLGRRQPDPGTVKAHAVSTGEDRAEFELGNLREIVGQPGEA